MNAEARIFACDPTSHGFGFVIFERPNWLVDWGHAHVRPCTHDGCLERAAGLLSRYAPDIVVVEDCQSSASRRGARVRKLLTGITRFADSSGADVARISIKDVQRIFAPNSSATKYEIAQMIAEAFPELAFRLPPPRKIWMSEDERMSIFDAAAFALTFYHTIEEIEL